MMKHCLVLVFLTFSFLVNAQFADQYVFSPNYSLPGKAHHILANTPLKPKSRFAAFQSKREAPVFMGMEATEVLEDFIKRPVSKTFSLSFALLHHVNKALGLVLSLRGHTKNVNIGYYAMKDCEPAQISIANAGEIVFETEHTNHFQKYWHHYFLIFESGNLILYHNGQKLDTLRILMEDIQDLRVVAYFQEEPYLEISNILKKLTIYDRAVDVYTVDETFSTFKQHITLGLKSIEKPYFMAGPYLHFTTPSSVNVIWETNALMEPNINFGKDNTVRQQLPKEKIEISHSDKTFIYQSTIDDLEPSQPYFYRIDLTSDMGHVLSTGVLTFKTALDPDTHFFSFGVIGDTETRPHINHCISKNLWAERPDFVLHLGDLTDGGMKNAKWQWNFEYFEGMGALHQRIPVFPVAGNGEGDLYWYKKYHVLPNDEAYYDFIFGNSHFFMLNSNTRENEFKPSGSQYVWLDAQLAKSTKLWKFVALHHAPYSADENDYGDSYQGPSDMGDKHVRHLIPLFEKHGVDMVFFGHLHSYNRIGPVFQRSLNNEKGTWYIQAGGAGGNLEDFAPNKSWFSQKTAARHHYCTININNDQLFLHTYDLDGALIDYMKLDK